jgi:hypothetical protein
VSGELASLSDSIERVARTYADTEVGYEAACARNAGYSLRVLDSQLPLLRVVGFQHSYLVAVVVVPPESRVDGTFSYRAEQVINITELTKAGARFPQHMSYVRRCLTDAIKAATIAALRAWWAAVRLPVRALLPEEAEPWRGDWPRDWGLTPGWDSEAYRGVGSTRSIDRGYRFYRARRVTWEEWE